MPDTTKQLQEFCTKIGVQISNLELLKEALTHRSYINEIRSHKLHHNERLEFLGDAVLELVTTEFLFKKYPERAEGELTSFRAALVRTESLAENAVLLEYGKYIYMSRGEDATGGRSRVYILANTFEAVIGAIYLDSGLEASREFISRTILPKIDNIVRNRLDIDPKSKLQEITQDTLKLTPSYKLKSEDGPDHDKQFTMVVYAGEKEIGEGKGRSKQEAEQKAAASALENWDNLYKKDK